MTWLEELHVELGRAGIRGRTRRRIELELGDHLACDPHSEERLGSPAEVAERFAAELRVARTRRSAWAGFGALAFAALGLAATTAAYHRAGGWPDVGGVRGLLVALTGLVVLFAPQVAFVAGTLGVLRVLALRRGEVAPAEVALVQRRMSVALVAGALTVTGMAAHVVLLWSLMPGSWDAVALASVVLPGAALTVAALALREARRLTPGAPGAAGGLVADVPAPLRPALEPVVAHPRRLLLLVGLPVCAFVLVATGHAEGSLLEGAERAVAEGLVFVGCFAALGRRLGIR